MKLIFNENFESDTLDNNKWNHSIGGHGWGNNELQYYTDSLKNCYIENNILHLHAYKEHYENNEYTSAKITTYSKFSFKYGIIEVVAKLPKSVGTWPAIWFLPNSIKQGLNWPLCGEIDLMEHVGTEPRFVHFSLHSKNNNFKTGTQRFVKRYLDNVLDGFHKYKMDWQENSIKFYYDDEQVAEFIKPVNATFEEWPFDQEFFLNLNLAIGGSWPGNPKDDFVEDEFLIKSIKVYESE